MNNIQKLRKEHGINQLQLAKLVGVSRSAVSMWEIGASEPGNDILLKLSEIFNTSVDVILDNELEQKKERPNKRGVKIPVLGIVPAGVPIEAVEDIIDYEEIDENMARGGDYFALKIKGDSMYPVIMDKDVVIVRQQSTADSGDTVIALVNGDDATCKKLRKQSNGIMLIPNNQEYETYFFTNREIEEKPVRIIGKVIEIRRSL